GGRRGKKGRSWLRPFVLFFFGFCGFGGIKRVLTKGPAKNFGEALRGGGGGPLLVGGWVRDFARGVESVDYDIEVYGLEAPVLRSLIEAHGKVDAVGEAFTVYKVRLRDRERRRSFVVDVSLPRRESKTGRGHRGFLVLGGPGGRFVGAACAAEFRH